MIAEIHGSTVVGQIEIDAAPENVFDAMTDPAQLAEWWGSPDTYRTHDWKVDLRPGGAWSCQATSPGGGGTVHGVYIAVDRPRVLAFTWNPSWDQAAETRVEMRFDPIPTGTRVSLVHSGFEDRAESQKGHAEGWQRVAGFLAKHFQKEGASA